MIPTLGDLLADAAKKLEESSVDDARREARLIAQFAFDIGLEKILGQPEWTPTAEALETFTNALARRSGREPLSQIVGMKEFWGLDFRVTCDTLTPRPDTETLVEAVLEAFPDTKAPLRILDLGLGTGCLLLSLLSEYSNGTGTGVDISPSALKVAQENADRLTLKDRVDLRLGNWFEPVRGEFDIIVSNPPYITPAEMAILQPEVSKYEPELALIGGEDGLACYRLIIGKAQAHLCPGGVVFLEVGAGQAAQVIEIGKKTGFKVLEVRCDLAGIERCIVLKG
jgi:release factor glutamine methyltransferase